MNYLLDSDTLIRSKNDSYRFDRHPGFWEWLEQSNILGVLGSIERVGRELTGEDELAKWAKKQGSRFFLPPDEHAIKSLAEVAKWVEAQTQFSRATKDAFLARADFELIGFAHAHGCKVVTFEKDEPKAIRAIKIPTACKPFGVQCMNVFRLIEELKPTFVLKT
jgi:hypothetical protein